MLKFPSSYWAVILGGSSGFGLATAKKLAAHGMNLCIVHRDRRGAMKRITPEFAAIEAMGIELLTCNVNALTAEGMTETLDTLATAMGASGRVRMLLHSIAYGNLKLLAPQTAADTEQHRQTLAALGKKLGVDVETLQAGCDELFDSGHESLAAIASPPAYNSDELLHDEDFTLTIHSMGSSLADWVQALFERQLFTSDARVLGLTSEGNQTAWRGYAAVSAAKVTLEAIARSIAVEYAAHGIRANIIQAGVTDTPALRLIPGSTHMKAVAKTRNPYRRLTTPEDVADFIFLMCLDEAAWANGNIIRVDGGERIGG